MCEPRRNTNFDKFSESGLESRDGLPVEIRGWVVCALPPQTFEMQVGANFSSGLVFNVLLLLLGGWHSRGQAA